MFKKSFAMLALAMLIPVSSGLAQTRSSGAYGSGVHQYFSGRHQAAIRSLNNAIAKDSKNARAYYFRGLAKMGSGDSSGAESDFQLGAMIESSSSKRKTSLVTRSLERVQGGMRMKLEKTRSRVFDGELSAGSSTTIASSIPVESFPAPIYHSEIIPAQTLGPVNLGPVTFDAPVAPPISQPVVSAPIIFEQPQIVHQQPPIIFEQPQPVFSQPIIEQPVIQQVNPIVLIEPQTVIQPQTVIDGGFQNVIGNGVQGIVDGSFDSSPPSVVTEPAPQEPVFGAGDLTAASTDTPLEGFVAQQPDQAMASKPAPDSTFGEVTEEGPSEDTFAPEPDDIDSFATDEAEESMEEKEMMAEKEMAEPASEEEAFPDSEEVLAGVQDPLGDSPAEDAFGQSADFGTAPSDDSAGDDSFGDAFASEPADEPDAMAAKEESAEAPDEFGGGDVFGATDDSAGSTTEDAFGFAASDEAPAEVEDAAMAAKEAVETPSEDVFGGNDDQAVASTDEDPFGFGDSSDEAGAGVDDAAMAAKEAVETVETPTEDVFGDQSVATAEDAFGFGDSSDTTNAGVDDAMTAKESVETPAEDAFGNTAGDSTTDEDPFGLATTVEPENSNQSEPFGASEATEETFGDESAPEEFTEDPFGQ